jgi:hypothetical protein
MVVQWWLRRSKRASTSDLRLNSEVDPFACGHNCADSSLSLGNEWMTSGVFYGIRDRNDGGFGKGYEKYQRQRWWIPMKF